MHQLPACFQTSAAFFHGNCCSCMYLLLASMVAAVHACICCLLSSMATAVHACICCLLPWQLLFMHVSAACLLFATAACCCMLSCFFPRHRTFGASFCKHLALSLSLPFVFVRIHTKFCANTLFRERIHCPEIPAASVYRYVQQCSRAREKRAIRFYVTL